jgi:hypothetical protein
MTWSEVRSLIVSGPCSAMSVPFLRSRECADSHSDVTSLSAQTQVIRLWGRYGYLRCFRAYSLVSCHGFQPHTFHRVISLRAISWSLCLCSLRLPAMVFAEPSQRELWLTSSIFSIRGHRAVECTPKGWVTPDDAGTVSLRHQRLQRDTPRRLVRPAVAYCKIVVLRSCGLSRIILGHFRS